MRAILIVLGLMLVAGLMVACMNGKPSQQMTVEETTVQKDWKSDGFIPVTVKVDTSREDPCKVLLHQDDSTTIWEPMGLDKTLMIDGSKLWVKVLAQRRKSECGGMPCSVTEAQMRK